MNDDLHLVIYLPVSLIKYKYLINACTYLDASSLCNKVEPIYY